MEQENTNVNRQLIDNLLNDCTDDELSTLRAFILSAAEQHREALSAIGLESAADKAIKHLGFDRDYS